MRAGMKSEKVERKVKPEDKFEVMLKDGRDIKPVIRSEFQTEIKKSDRREY